MPPEPADKMSALHFQTPSVVIPQRQVRQSTNGSIRA